MYLSKVGSDANLILECTMEGTRDVNITTKQKFSAEDLKKSFDTQSVYLKLDGSQTQTWYGTGVTKALLPVLAVGDSKFIVFFNVTPSAAYLLAEFTQNDDGTWSYFYMH